MKPMRTLDLCIPAYNEARIISQSLEVIRMAVAGIEDLSVRIVVADNGSTDGTAETVRALGLKDLEVITVEARGKGAAIVSAAQHSNADYFGFIDADISADPEEIPRFVTALIAGADIVIGSRLLEQKKITRAYLRTLSSQLFNQARRLTLGIAVADTQCGLKIMNGRGRDVMRSCTEQGWFLDLEFLARAERAGLVIDEQPIAWDEYRYPDRLSKLKVLRDGISSLFAMIRIRNAIRAAQV